jgi:exodeoxyribonuclease V alpha subunit
LRAELLAPTGKAAMRLAEAIRAAKGDLACSPEIREWIPEATRTIHRCLGAIGPTGTRFRHGPRPRSMPTSCSSTKRRWSTSR